MKYKGIEFDYWGVYCNDPPNRFWLRILRETRKEAIDRACEIFTNDAPSIRRTGRCATGGFPIGVARVVLTEAAARSALAAAEVRP